MTKYAKTASGLKDMQIDMVTVIAQDSQCGLKQYLNTTAENGRIITMISREEAIRILDPKTTREALAEIEYHAGFNGQRAVMEAVNEACVIGAETLHRQEAVVKWLRKEASLYVTAEDDYHKGIRAGIRYAIDVLANYNFDDNDKVRAGEHHG